MKDTKPRTIYLEQMKDSGDDRFDEHLERWRNSGGIGCLLRVEDVSFKVMAKIAAEAFAACSLSATEEGRKISYANVLHKYGIMCPHPQNERLYSGDVKSPIPLIEHRWYNCEMCGCSVISEQHFRKRDEKEKDSSGQGTSLSKRDKVIT